MSNTNTPEINRTVLMSGADFMSNASAINPYMHEGEPFDQAEAIQEHSRIQAALEQAGVKVIKVDPPSGCQDGIFTANWALVRGDKALMSALPGVRQPEQAYAQQILQNLGKQTFTVPAGVKFSGQGDALPCGDYVFAGTGYRNDPAAHKAIEETLGYKVIAVQAIPARNADGQPLINAASGWPDSQFYDIDLAISVLKWPEAASGRRGLIGWCPDALTPDSQALIRSLDFVDKIEVSFQEATDVAACNLVSTGRHVVMNAGAPRYQAAIEAAGLTVTTTNNQELAKNGGSVRCCSLTLDNPA